jgi:hypothetical protein
VEANWVLPASRLGQSCTITCQQEGKVIRFAILTVPLVLAACADQSKGSALNECRTRYYLDDPAIQEKQIRDCMQARSFAAVPACNPAPDEHEWDWQVQAFSFNNPRCYEPVGSIPWLATFLSPM